MKIVHEKAGFGNSFISLILIFAVAMTQCVVYPAAAFANDPIAVLNANEQQRAVVDPNAPPPSNNNSVPGKTPEANPDPNGFFDNPTLSLPTPDPADNGNSSNQPIDPGKNMPNPGGENSGDNPNPGNSNPGNNNPGTNPPGNLPPPEFLQPPATEPLDDDEQITENRTLEKVDSWYAYDLNLEETIGFKGGAAHTSADFTGDGIADVITVSGPGAAAHIEIFDPSRDGIDSAGRTQPLKIASVIVSQFTNGMTVATGDMNGDGVPEIIIGYGFGGGSRVEIFDGASIMRGVASQFRVIDAAFPGFNGAVTVASGDVDGDGVADVIVGAGPTGPPHVKVFSGASGNELRSFYAFDPQFVGGIYVSSTDMDHDGKAEIIVGAGPGAGPHVKVFSGATNEEKLSFYAFDPAFSGGVTVGGFGKTLVVGSGRGPNAHVVVFDVNIDAAGNFSVDRDHPRESFYPTETAFAGGIYVSADSKGFVVSVWDTTADALSGWSRMIRFEYVLQTPVATAAPAPVPVPIPPVIPVPTEPVPVPEDQAPVQSFAFANFNLSVFFNGTETILIVTNPDGTKIQYRLPPGFNPLNDRFRNPDPRGGSLLFGRNPRPRNRALYFEDGQLFNLFLPAGVTADNIQAVNYLPGRLIRITLIGGRVVEFQLVGR